MKKIVYFIFCLSLVIPSLVLAGWGTPVPLNVTSGSAFKTWAITGTASGTTFADYNSTTTDQNFMKGYYIYLAEITMGSTAPADNFKIEIMNDDNTSLTGGALDDCDNATHSKFYMFDLDTIRKYTPPVDGRIKIRTTENTIDSASYTIKLYLMR